jgi:hypothetical protein
MEIYKDIDPTNLKGQLHGYQEWYSLDGKLVLRGHSKNDMDIGYQEYHRLKQTEFHIK